MKIILASASPRRSELLKQIGLEFTQATSDFCECVENTNSFSDLVIANAQGKAGAVKANENEVVVAADTIVVLDKAVLGKPQNMAQAKKMLSCLSGKTHEVFIGVCVRHGGKIWSDFEKTKVTMLDLPEKEIDDYVATKEPLDKAGAYDIQGKGALLVKKIDGCYFNVVGLLLVCLRGLLEKAGFIFEY